MEVGEEGGRMEEGGNGLQECRDVGVGSKRE